MYRRLLFTSAFTRSQKKPAGGYMSKKDKITKSADDFWKKAVEKGVAKKHDGISAKIDPEKSRITADEIKMMLDEAEENFKHSVY